MLVLLLILQLTDMIAKLKELSGGLMDEAGADKPLPPASVQSFLKDTKENPFPAVVISDHKANFTNK